jgi:hypothetical protein
MRSNDGFDNVEGSGIVDGIPVSDVGMSAIVEGTFVRPAGRVEESVERLAGTAVRLDGSDKEGIPREGVAIEADTMGSVNGRLWLRDSVNRGVSEVAEE